VHLPPTQARADFSIMMDCTPEIGHCHSVYTLCSQHVYSAQWVEQPRAEEGRPQAPEPVHRSRCPGPGGRTHDQVGHAFVAVLRI
jgi:hypothetical protein